MRLLRTLILAGGIAGTDGIIHTGLGPLDVQSGSTFKYGRIAYHHDQFRLQGFVNSLNGNLAAIYNHVHGLRL